MCDVGISARHLLIPQYLGKLFSDELGSLTKSAADFPFLEDIKVWMIFHCLPEWSPLAIPAS